MQNDERGIRVKDPVSLGHEEGRSRMTKNGTVAKRDPITGSSGRPRMSVGLKNPGKWKLDGALERINHQKKEYVGPYIGIRPVYGGTLGREWEVRNRWARYPLPDLVSFGYYYAHVKRS